MSVTVAGISASAYYSNDTFHSRMSTKFAELSRHLSRYAHENVGPLSVTASTSDGCFTAVVDFVTDGLCQQDIILGRDWSEACSSNGVQLIDSFPLYHGDLASTMLPDHVALSSDVMSLHDKFDKAHDDYKSDYKPDNVSRHNGEIDPATCSSSSPPPMLPRNVQQGYEYLAKALLGNYETGIVASLFNVNVKSDTAKLRHLVSMHGISSHGLSASDCKIVLLRHIFSGHCVSKQCSSLDRTACSCFSRDFQSAEEMSFAAFNIVSTSKSNQRSADDLLHLLQDLDIVTKFQPQHLRRQICRELSKQAKDFLSSR